MNSQLNGNVFRELRRLLTVLRASDFRDSDRSHFISFGRCLGFSSGLYHAGLITLDQWFQLDGLVLNASAHAGRPLPSSVNAGPVMPARIRLERQFPAVKPQAQVLADEHSCEVSAPAPRPELRLLCLLVTSRTGETRSLPVHTLRPMPPRVVRDGRWSLASDAGFTLRETQAVRPSATVLARYSRQRQAHAVCADSRTIRAKGVSYVR